MRTHYCGTVTDTDIDSQVLLHGWVHRRRDHGGVIFVDLRDRTGLVQVVFHPENKEVFALAESLRSEYVIEVKGQVRPRPEGTVNPDMNTGMIEVETLELVLLNRSEPPPVLVDAHDVKESEEVRLQYRYLDLRRPDMQNHFIVRSKVTKYMRDYMEKEGFLDIETPMLTKATPEGARDYIVPSRTHQGSFFALPQSPQLFKQLLMMSGMDRYYQIVRCFRDEDLRADRQPEFTQLDIEASFMNEQEILDVCETMIIGLFKEVLDVELPSPFPRMPYAQAMAKYGSDKPDLRNPLELIDIAELVKGVDFKVFKEPANSQNGRVAALRLPNGAKLLSRKEIDDLANFVGIYGAKGLAYIKVNDLSKGVEGLQSPILKFLGEEVALNIVSAVQAQDNDLIFFGADKAKVVNEAMGALRDKLGRDCDLLTSQWQPLWVVDWPTFEHNEDAGRWDPMHHPFTAPVNPQVQAMQENPGESLSKAYDMVLNGCEVGGGSIRIHDYKMQQAVFDVLNISEQEAEQKFGFFVNAMKYGCPPHGGIAFGLDRLVMLMCGATSIRDVIAFPKTQTAACPLTGAPSMVPFEQLREVGIKVKHKEKEQSDLV